MSYRITIEDTGECYPCSAGETLLRSMEKLGRKGIPIGCRGGGCGVCKVQIIEGRYSSGTMSREHVSRHDEAAERILACRIWPQSDMRVRVLGLMKKSVYASKP